MIRVIKVTKKSILFSGLNGPLGYALNEIKNDEIKLSGFRSSQCNLTDSESAKQFFQKFLDENTNSNVSYLHIAALSGGSHLSERIPATLFTQNITMAMNALESARLCGIKRIILVLSTACYSSKIENPREEELHNFPIETSEYGYAYAKRMFEVLMRAYNQQHQMEISCVLVNGIIGAGMHFGEDRSILPAALIKKFYLARANDSKIELWGDGTPIREYTSARDLARALIWCVSNQEKNTLLNIGNNQKTTVKELALLIARKMGIEENRISFEGGISAGRKIQSTDNTLFRKLSNFQYEDIDNAIESAINFFEAEALR
jgi:GDP-L-fucose synthase